MTVQLTDETSVQLAAGEVADVHSLSSADGLVVRLRLDSRSNSVGEDVILEGLLLLYIPEARSPQVEAHVCVLRAGDHSLRLDVLLKAGRAGACTVTFSAAQYVTNLTSVNLHVCEDTHERIGQQLPNGQGTHLSGSTGALRLALPSTSASTAVGLREHSWQLIRKAVTRGVIDAEQSDVSGK